MIAVDTNILVYAHRFEAPFNQAAFERLTELANGTAAWGIPWPCLHEFLGVVTSPRAFPLPTSLERALGQIEIWLESPSLVLLTESPTHWTTLRAILVESAITGPRVHDARIAALCRQHGVRELWSADRDFSRFAGLKVVNPLIGQSGFHEQ